MTSPREDDQFPHDPHHCGDGLNVYVSSDSKRIKLEDVDGKFIVLTEAEADQLRDTLDESPADVEVHTVDNKPLSISTTAFSQLRDWLHTTYPPNAEWRK